MTIAILTALSFQPADNAPARASHWASGPSPPLCGTNLTSRPRRRGQGVHSNDKRVVRQVITERYKAESQITRGLDHLPVSKSELHNNSMSFRTLLIYFCILPVI
jgi:hypothetical protein